MVSFTKKEVLGLGGNQNLSHHVEVVIIISYASQH